MKPQYPLQLLKTVLKLNKILLKRTVQLGDRYGDTPDNKKMKRKLNDRIHCFEAAIELLTPHKKQITK